jgi:FkbM family methyltransferase
MDQNINTTTALWSPSKPRRWLAMAAYPLVWAVNRPSAAWLAGAIYDLALRCNGIAINYPGRDGLTVAEERFLGRIAAEIKGGVVFDVGANVGAYSQALLRIAPGAEIHAFEPHPSTFRRLAKRLAGEEVTLCHQALSDHEAMLELYDFAAADGSTQASLSRAAVAIFDGDIVAHTVRSTTIDAYMTAMGIDHLALLKIDTEGLDLKVLQGAQRAIRERRIARIQFEFVPANIATHTTMRDVFEALPGYRIHRLCLNGALLPLFPYEVKRCEIYVTQNLVALPA